MTFEGCESGLGELYSHRGQRIYKCASGWDLFETANIRLEGPTDVTEKNGSQHSQLLPTKNKTYSLTRYAYALYDYKEFLKEYRRIVSGLSGRLARLQSSNILTTKMKKPIGRVTILRYSTTGDIYNDKGIYFLLSILFRILKLSR